MSFSISTEVLKGVKDELEKIKVDLNIRMDTIESKLDEVIRKLNQIEKNNS